MPQSARFVKQPPVEVYHSWRIVDSVTGRKMQSMEARIPFFATLELRGPTKAAYDVLETPEELAAAVLVTVARFDDAELTVPFGELGEQLMIPVTVSQQRIKHRLVRNKKTSVLELELYAVDLPLTHFFGGAGIKLVVLLRETAQLLSSSPFVVKSREPWSVGAPCTTGATKDAFVAVDADVVVDQQPRKRSVSATDSGVSLADIRSMSAAIRAGGCGGGGGGSAAKKFARNAASVDGLTVSKKEATVEVLPSDLSLLTERAVAAFKTVCTESVSPPPLCAQPHEDALAGAVGHGFDVPLPEDWLLGSCAAWSGEWTWRVVHPESVAPESVAHPTCVVVINDDDDDALEDIMAAVGDRFVGEVAAAVVSV